MGCDDPNCMICQITRSLEGGGDYVENSDRDRVGRDRRAATPAGESGDSADGAYMTLDGERVRITEWTKEFVEGAKRLGMSADDITAALKMNFAISRFEELTGVQLPKNLRTWAVLVCPVHGPEGKTPVVGLDADALNSFCDQVEGEMADLRSRLNTENSGD